MKKKLISIVLVMSMLVSVFSVTFTASAGEVSNAQWNNLIVALKTDTVKNLSHTGEANNVSVVDTDGSIITAVNALYSVISTMNPTDEGKDSGIRTSSKLKAYILSELQSKMSAADFSEYNINISVDVLLGKPEISDSDDLASSTSDVTSRLIVNKSKTAI